MSRTMKADEAIMALAFLSNPETLTKAPDSSIPEMIREKRFGGGFHGRLTEAITNLVSEQMLDLYSTGEKGGTATPATASTNSETGNSSDHQRRVFFGCVEVRKYPITIGANPSVSRGVPRTIEWDHLEEETELHHIDDYEEERPGRKRGEELLLNGVTRERMLTNLGFTKKQLFEGIRRAKEHVSGNGGGHRRKSSNNNNDSVSWRMQSKR